MRLIWCDCKMNAFMRESAALFHTFSLLRQAIRKRFLQQQICVATFCDVMLHVHVHESCFVDVYVYMYTHVCIYIYIHVCVCLCVYVSPCVPARARSRKYSARGFPFVNLKRKLRADLCGSRIQI